MAAFALVAGARQRKFSVSMFSFLDPIRQVFSHVTNPRAYAAAFWRRPLPRRSSPQRISTHLRMHPNRAAPTVQGAHGHHHSRGPPTRTSSARRSAPAYASWLVSGPRGGRPPTSSGRTVGNDLADRRGRFRAAAEFIAIARTSRAGWRSTSIRRWQPAHTGSQLAEQVRLGHRVRRRPCDAPGSPRYLQPQGAARAPGRSPSRCNSRLRSSSSSRASIDRGQVRCVPLVASTSAVPARMQSF